MITLLIMMFLRCLNTCQRDIVKDNIEEILSFLNSRKLVTLLLSLKIIPIIVISITFIMLSMNDYFRSKTLLFSLVVVQILIYTGFNIFNIYRLEQDDGDYYVMNTRYTDYVSIFFVDIVLIAVFMFVLLVLR